MNKKLPLRMCVGCRKMHEKHTMLRICKIGFHEPFLDTTYKMGGRGCYICKDITCFNIIKKNRGIDRSLKKKIPVELYNLISKEILILNE